MVLDSPQLRPIVARSRNAIALIAVLCAVSGCADTDLSSAPKYAGIIGSEYRTKTPLFALGLKSSADPKQIGRYWVSPFPGTDPNVAFRGAIPIGHIFRVMAVRKRFVPFENGLQFIVATEGLGLPPAIEIVIPLYGHMESTDGFPDPNRFERVPAPAPR